MKRPDICKCGHSKDEHRSALGDIKGCRYFYLSLRRCPCKKYTPSPTTAREKGSVVNQSPVGDANDFLARFEAMFELLHLLDDKLTKVNLKFDRMAKELGYKT